MIDIIIIVAWVALMGVIAWVLEYITRIRTSSGTIQAPEIRALFDTDPKRVNVLTWGVLVRSGSIWIGAHYAPYNRRWCVNIVPCVTVWVALKGGRKP